jgi:hypothetical protein
MHILLLLLVVIVHGLLLLARRSIRCENSGCCIHWLWLRVVNKVRTRRVWSVCGVLVLHHVFRA